jgi:hypothetical protein
VGGIFLSRNKKLLSFLIICLFLTITISSAKADTVITTDVFNVDFLTGEAFAYQDLLNAFTITFTISDGNLTGTASLDTTDTGGTLSITPTDTGVIAVTATSTNYTLYVNGAEQLGGTVQFVNGANVIISWVYNNIILPNYPEVLNVKPFWMYLMSGNFLGFLGAIFLWSFILQDILVGAICMLFLIPIYIRTKSLLLLCILWILLGGFFIAAMPSVSGLAIIFLILGIAGVFWRLVRSN